MTKTKQATLFSLKSWKNVAAEGIQRYKNILANKNETDSEILKALVSLKKKNPSRDVILSSKIDLLLEFLEKHQNPRICNEAQLLRRRWQLNKNCSSEIIVLDDEEPPLKKRRIVPEIEICKIKATRKQTTECSKPQTIGHSEKKQATIKSFVIDSNEPVPSATAKPVSKSSLVKRATYNNIINELYNAVKLFTQELGEQEVRLYLENN